MASVINTAGPVDAPAAIGLIDKATVNDPFSELELVNSTGTPIAATGTAGEVSLVGQAWVTGVFQGDQPYAGNVTLTSSGRDLQWLMAAPAATNNLKFSGLLIGVIGLEPWSGGGGGSNQLASLLSGVTGAGGASVSVTAVNSSRQPPLHDHHGQRRLAHLGADAGPSAPSGPRSSNAAIAAAFSGSGRSGSSQITVNGTSTITGYAEASDVQWAILVSEPASQALSGVTDLRNSGFIVLAVGLVLATLFSFVMAQLAVRPLRACSRAARRVSAGDLSARVSPSGAVEVATLGEAFNLMVARLEGLIGRVQGTEHRPLRFGHPPGGRIQSARGHHRPADLGAAETSASMEELARTSAHIAETVERVATQAAETRDNLDRAHERILTSRSAPSPSPTGSATSAGSSPDQRHRRPDQPARPQRRHRGGSRRRGGPRLRGGGRRGAAPRRPLQGAGRRHLHDHRPASRSETSATVLAMDKGAAQLQIGLGLMEQVAEASSRIRLATQQQHSATEQVVEAMEQVRIASQQVSTTAQELAWPSGSQATMAGDLKEVSTVVVTVPAPSGRRGRGGRTPATDEPANSKRRGRAPTTPPPPRALGLAPAGSGSAAPVPVAPPPPAPPRPDRSA